MLKRALHAPRKVLRHNEARDGSHGFARPVPETHRILLSSTERIFGKDSQCVKREGHRERVAVVNGHVLRRIAQEATAIAWHAHRAIGANEAHATRLT